MNIRKKIISQKNWKLKMQITLLIPLIFVIVYIVAQTGAIDMSSITGFATLGAKGNGNNDDSVLPEGSSNNLSTENDDLYSIFASDSNNDNNQDDNNNNSSDNQSNQDDNLEEGNVTQNQEPPVLGGGGGSSGGATDDEPVVIPPTENTTDDNVSESHGSTGAIPDRPANFWGLLKINNINANPGETIIVTVNNTEYQITTLDDGYYTINVPGTDGAIVEFSYNDTVIANSTWSKGAVKELNLTFNK